MRAFEVANYCPVLRWKKGEYEALASLDDPVKDRLLPHIILPPLKARDVELNRQLSRAEFARVQVSRISSHWNRRVCLVDARHMKFARGHSEDGENFRAFLDAAIDSNCAIVPIVDLHTSQPRLEAIRAYCEKAQVAPAFSVAMLDLDRADLASKVRTRLDALAVAASDCVLILDLSDAEFSQIEEFSSVVVGWVHRLQDIGLWFRIVVEASSYPEFNPVKPNASLLLKRKEWLTWTNMRRIDPQISKQCIYGDFGADSAKIEFGGGGMPIVHLRYATQNNWFVCRGGIPHDLGDGSIRQVARWIIESKYCSEETFSLADEIISDWAASRISVGTASTWRKVNMNRHMTFVAFELAELASSAMSRRTTRRSPTQATLIS